MIHIPLNDLLRTTTIWPNSILYHHGKITFQDEMLQPSWKTSPSRMKCAFSSIVHDSYPIELFTSNYYHLAWLNIVPSWKTSPSRMKSCNHHGKYHLPRWNAAKFDECSSIADEIASSASTPLRCLILITSRWNFNHDKSLNWAGQLTNQFS